MEERGMNARIKALRKLSENTQAHIDMERAKSETETYKKYEGELSIPELRAQVLKDYFSTKSLYIGDGELIVGEKGNEPWAAYFLKKIRQHIWQKKVWQWIWAALPKAILLTQSQNS